jgi:chromate transporter
MSASGPTAMTIEGTSGTTEPIAVSPASYSLWQLVDYFLRLGTWGFGGPVALVGYMHRDLVERRGWISEAEYKEGLTLAQLMPGPLAAQLAIYLGYVHYGVVGATAAGVAFVLPSFLMVLALGWAYVAYGGLSWMQSVFYGVGACVIGIILVSAFRLTKKTIGTNKLLWTIYLISASVTIVTEQEMIWLFLGAGVVTLLVNAPPKWLTRRFASTNGGADMRASAVLPLAMLPAIPAASGKTLLQMFLFFTKAGAFVFGSGLAIVPFLYSGVVKEHAWLTEQQFLDAVAVAMITPGPVVITVGFIGFLVGGFPGAVVAAAATFLPCYLLTIIPAPYFRKHGKQPSIVAFVDGVTAAAVGALAGAVVILGQRTIFGQSWTPDIAKAVILLVTLGLILQFKKLPEPVLILAAGFVGLIVHPMISA